MKLFEIIEAIDTFDRDGTIFSQEIDNSFQPQSDAVVITLTDEELEINIDDFAASRCPGKSYFLEISLVQEILEGWADNHNGQPPTTEQACKCVIHYAKYDAYPPSFFNQ